MLTASVVTTTTVYLIAVPASTIFPHPLWWQVLGVAATPVAIESAGWALGLAVYRQRSYVAAVKVQAAQEVRTQAELAARSAAEERLRIARELHDVVAHAMSVITVQAGVARYIDTEMPERASAALETIESTGRQALRDMRQLLGVLRAEGEAVASAPAPALSDLGELVEGMRAAGTRVDLRVGGDVRQLPEGLELSAYRIVQEALTNVVKHAATDRARVDLRYQPEELAIEIVDDGAGARAGTTANGHGLIGMRERAALHGGSLDAGPLPVRGYRVAARLPIAASLEAVPA
jgi:signal transduction histidine kinase